MAPRGVAGASGAPRGNVLEEARKHTTQQNTNGGKTGANNGGCGFDAAPGYGLDDGVWRLLVCGEANRRENYR
jgi:hypothetical protein